MNFIKRYMCCCFVKRWVDAGSISVVNTQATTIPTSTKHAINTGSEKKSSLNVLIDDGRISELSMGSF